jgi:uncharacterized protein GlcG (DUF336 family)
MRPRVDFAPVTCAVRIAPTAARGHTAAVAGRLDRSTVEEIPTMSNLRLAQASALIAAALAEGRRRGLAPLAVTVLDAGGHLVAFQREDGAGFLRFDIAYGKAWGALGMGFGTRELAERAAKVPTFVNALAATSHGRAVPSPGGVIILAGDGAVIGAVGISGDTGDHDEACALAGIAAVGLVARPGAGES